LKAELTNEAVLFENLAWWKEKEQRENHRTQNPVVSYRTVPATRPWSANPVEDSPHK